MLTPKQLRANIEAYKEINEAELKDRGKKRRSRWEYYVFIFVLAFSLAFAAWIRVSEVNHYKRMLLHTQLWQMRNAIYMYYSIYGDLPENLGMFLKQSSVNWKSGRAIPFVEGVQVDSYDRVIDPLGYPFIYDNKKGTIHSQAPCCRDW